MNESETKLETVLSTRIFWDEFKPGYHFLSNLEKQIPQDQIKNFNEVLHNHSNTGNGGTTSLVLSQIRSRFSFRASEITQWFHHAMDVTNVMECLTLMREAYWNIGYLNQLEISDCHIFPIKTYSDLKFSAKSNGLVILIRSKNLFPSSSFSSV